MQASEPFWGWGKKNKVFFLGGGVLNSLTKFNNENITFYGKIERKALLGVYRGVSTYLMPCESHKCW